MFIVQCLDQSQWELMLLLNEIQAFTIVSENLFFSADIAKKVVLLLGWSWSESYKLSISANQRKWLNSNTSDWSKEFESAE